MRPLSALQVLNKTNYVKKIDKNNRYDQASNAKLNAVAVEVGVKCERERWPGQDTVSGKMTHS